MECDVAIIGGGPAGATAGAILRKYDPNLNVAILERERFPREHVGESGLPSIGPILDEMGCWDKVEAANFPIKIGATYRWGRSPELWHFEFLPFEEFKDEPRPAKFEGQRRVTAFQVDRAYYDQILLQHARELGCVVRQPEKVLKIERNGDRVEGLVLDSGEAVTARYYIDGSGESGLLRRALDIPVEYPTTLKNIAIWQYWQNADWAVEIGIGGTRIQILTVGFGWFWFIPLGPTRTSIGLVLPAEYYKKSGKRPEELYQMGLAEEAILQGLLKNATSEGKTHTTKDWSFISERHSGENWFLAGESGGFADPILSAGLSLTHSAARETAYTILELDRKTQDPGWLRSRYDHRQSHRIRTHIRFADFWYTSNAQFNELKEFTSGLAKDAGLSLSPDEAWQWLAQGGFINDEYKTGVGGFSTTSIKDLGEFLTDLDTGSHVQKNNVFILSLDGAVKEDQAQFKEGHVNRIPGYRKGSNVLPIQGVYQLLLSILQREQTLPGIVREIGSFSEQFRSQPQVRFQFLMGAVQGLEALVTDGWVKASCDSSLPLYEQLEFKTNSMRWAK